MALIFPRVLIVFSLTLEYSPQKMKMQLYQLFGNNVFFSSSRV